MTENRDKDQRGGLLAEVFMNDNAESVSVFASDFISALTNSDEISKRAGELLTYEKLSETLMKVNVKSPTDSPFQLMALSASGNAKAKLFGAAEDDITVTPGDYFLVINTPLVDASTGETLVKGGLPADGALISKDPEAVKSDAIEPLYIEIHDTEGEQEPSTAGYVFRYAKTGRLVMFRDIALTLPALIAITLAAEKIGLSREETEVIEEGIIATYKTEQSFSNHSFMLKTLDEGLFSVAMGEPYYTLTPKTKRSKEWYKLTASEDACANFFAQLKGNAEIVKDVLETVYTLRKDERAAGFVYKGRIWFTVNTIVQEMRRTKKGTVRARNYQKDRELVDGALRAVSGAQIVGEDASGKPTNTYYLVNAIRRERLEYNGNTYTDVWGFMLNEETANDYAASEINHSYNYPLLDMGAPMTLEEAWIERYLKDALNQARSELYETTRNGNPKPSKKEKAIVSRSWSSIFEHAQPIGAMRADRKTKLVKTFEKMLRVLADMDCHGKLREGYRMSITAYSKRNAGKGKGRGAWETLVIECVRETHTPIVYLEGNREEAIKAAKAEHL